MDKLRWHVGLGQDHHVFTSAAKDLVLGGLIIPEAPGLKGNSDADVILHALANAISSVTKVRIIGPVADELCKQGITDSAVYLKKALETLEPAHNPGQRVYELVSISIALEGKRPKLQAYLPEIEANVAKLCHLSALDVGATVTTGEGLTGMGQGEGLACLVTVSICEHLA